MVEEWMDAKQKIIYIKHIIMWRLDTAWFWKYSVFHWHSKNLLVIWWDDTGPIDNPTTPYDPEDDTPPWYEYEDWKYVPTWPWVVIDPEPIPIDTPTVETQCRRFTSRGSGIKTTASWVITWYDANSWWQWTFKCYDKIVFYWRLNASASSWLVNDIRWWAGNHMRSFTVPAWSIDEQSIFKFTEEVNWDYKIEVKRKASWNLYYDWVTYETWHLSEADWETLYVWVSALAEIWYVWAYAPDEIVTIYTSNKWNIKHNISKMELTLTKDNWQSITIMDRNVWATKYYNESWATDSEWYWNYYQWWNNYWFPESWWVSTSWTQVDTTWYSCSNPYSSSTFITSPLDPYWAAAHQDWSSSANNSLWSNWCIWPCPVWYHIPSYNEAKNLLDYWAYITWIDRTDSNTFNYSKRNQLCNNLLIPMNWRRHFNWWYVDSRGTWSSSSYKALLWTTDTSRWSVGSDSWVCINIDNYWAYVWDYESWSEYPIPFGKINWIAIRPFKNT